MHRTYPVRLSRDEDGLVVIEPARSSPAKPGIMGVDAPARSSPAKPGIMGVDANGPFRTSLRAEGGVLFADIRDIRALSAALAEPDEALWIGPVFGAEVAARVPQLEPGQSAELVASPGEEADAVIRLLAGLWWRRWAPLDERVMEEWLLDAEIGAAAQRSAALFGTSALAAEALLDVPQRLADAVRQIAHAGLDPDESPLVETILEAAEAADALLRPEVPGAHDLAVVLDAYLAADEAPPSPQPWALGLPPEQRFPPKPSGASAAILDPRDTHSRAAAAAWWWADGDDARATVRVHVDTASGSVNPGVLFASVFTDDPFVIALSPAEGGYAGAATVPVGTDVVAVAIWDESIGVSTRAPRRAPDAEELRASVAAAADSLDPALVPLAAARAREGESLSVHLNRYELAASSGDKRESKSSASHGMKVRVVSVTPGTVHVSVEAEPGIARPLDVVVIESLDDTEALAIVIPLAETEDGRLEGGATLPSTGSWVDVTMRFPRALGRLAPALHPLIVPSVRVATPVGRRTWIAAARGLPVGDPIRALVREGLQ